MKRSLVGGDLRLILRRALRTHPTEYLRHRPGNTSLYEDISMTATSWSQKTHDARVAILGEGDNGILVSLVREDKDVEYLGRYRDAVEGGGGVVG